MIITVAIMLSDTKQALLRSRLIGVVKASARTPQLVSVSKGFRLVGKNEIQVESGVCEWPSRTDLLCWHCAQPFGTPPIPKPIGFDERLQRWKVQGSYCTWACALAGCTSIREGGHLSQLHQQVCGSKRRIQPAPPKYMLKAFGGTMDVEEFRACEEEYQVVPSRLVTVDKLNVHTSTIQRTKPAEGKVDFSSVNASNDVLKLKRDKPLPSGRGRISMHTKVRKCPVA